MHLTFVFVLQYLSPLSSTELKSLQVFVVDFLNLRVFCKMVKLLFYVAICIMARAVYCMEDDDTIISTGMDEKTFRFFCEPTYWTPHCSMVCKLFPNFCQPETTTTTEIPGTTPTTTTPTSTPTPAESTTTTAPPTTTTSAPVECNIPVVDYCSGKPDATNLKNPCSCASFVQCSDGHADIISCPSGLEWNEDIPACDYPGSAQCTLGPSTDTPTPTPTSGTTSTEPSTEVTTSTASPTQEPTTTAPPTTTTSAPNGCKKAFDCTGKPNEVYKNPCSCTSFVECNDGVATIRPCAQGLEWNEQLSYCDWPESAKCTVGPSTDTPTTSGTTTTEPTTEVTTSPNPVPTEPSCQYSNNCGPAGCVTCYNCETPSCCASGYSLQAAEACNNQFDACQCFTDEGTTSAPTTTPVPTTTELVTTTAPPTTTNGCQNSFDCSDKPNNVYKNPCSCTSFIRCDNGVATIRPCPDGLEWNEQQSVCDRPDYAQCTSLGPSTDTPTTTSGTTTTEPTTEVTTNPTPAPTEPACQSGNICGPSGCVTCYNCETPSCCANGFSLQPVELCNNKYTACQCFPDEGTTSAPTTTPAPTTTELVTTAVPPTTTPDPCAPPNEPYKEDCSETCVGKPDGTYPDANRCCDWYYTCTCRVPTAKSCPIGEHFDPIKLICDAIENVTCWNCVPPVIPEPIPESTTPIPCVQTSCVDKPAGDYPSPLHCEYSVQCDGAGNFVQLNYCPGDGIFSPDTLQCEDGVPCTVCTPNGGSTSPPSKHWTKFNALL